MCPPKIIIKLLYSFFDANQDVPEEPQKWECLTEEALQLSRLFKRKGGRHYGLCGHMQKNQAYAIASSTECNTEFSLSVFGLLQGAANKTKNRSREIAKQ